MEIYLSLVRSEVANVLSINESAVDVNAALVADLNADSLDIVDLSYSLGKKLKITMPTGSIYQHAEEILDSDYLNSLFTENGELTQRAKQLFKMSCYSYTDDQLDKINSLGDLYDATSVYNWASLCKTVSESEHKNADKVIIDQIKSFVISK